MHTIGTSRKPGGGVKLPETESSTFIGSRVKRARNHVSSFIGDFAVTMGIEAIQPGNNNEIAVDSPERKTESTNRWSETYERWLLLVEKHGPGAILQGLFPGPEIDDEAWMVEEPPVNPVPSRLDQSE